MELSPTAAVTLAKAVCCFACISIAMHFVAVVDPQRQRARQKQAPQLLQLRRHVAEIAEAWRFCPVIVRFAV